MRPGSGIAVKNRRDFGNEGKFWSGWRDQRTPLGRTLYYVKQTTQARNLVSELHFKCKKLPHRYKRSLTVTLIVTLKRIECQSVLAPQGVNNE